MNVLEGIKVLDFTRLLPGPVATHLLAQAGAEVTKVEHPKRQDFAKHTMPFIEGQATLYEALNHRKKVVSIDYNTAVGHSKILALVKEADIIIEQFRPGVMEAWGLGFKTLKRFNQKIVYISLTGYGQTGPLANQAGHDLNYLANSGILSLNRDEQGKPVIPGIQIADIGGGAYMAYAACMMGLFHKERTKQAIYMDVAMLDGLIPLLSIPITQQWGGLAPNIAKVLHGGLVNYNVYQCKDDKWIALGALELKFWNNFCELVEKMDWKKDDVLALSVHIFPKKEIEELFLSKTRKEWIELTQEQDVCLSPILELEELEQQEQLKARQAFTQFKTPKGTSMKGLGFPLKVKS